MVAAETLTTYQSDELSPDNRFQQSIRFLSIQLTQFHDLDKTLQESRYLNEGALKWHTILLTCLAETRPLLAFARLG